MSTVAMTTELLLKTAKTYELSVPTVSDRVRKLRPWISASDAEWLVDGFFQGNGIPVVVAEAVIDLVIEHKDLWKDRYEAADQALKATIEHFNKALSDG